MSKERKLKSMRREEAERKRVADSIFSGIIDMK